MSTTGSTRTRPGIFMHDDGRVACDQHVGSTARGDLGRAPTMRADNLRRRTLRTIDGAFIELLAIDKMAYRAEVGVSAACEMCGRTH